MTRKNGRRTLKWSYERRNPTTVDVVARGPHANVARRLPHIQATIAAVAPRIIRDSSTAVVVRIPNDLKVIAAVNRELGT